MIDFAFSSHCTGCGACADICPKQCISLKDDERGFVIPSVNLSDCVDCGLCEKICPILITPPLYIRKTVCCAYNNNSEERAKGSSGSIMLALARELLSRGGAIYGAAFDNKLQLHHTRAVTYDQVVLQSKSKYIQSNLRGIYQSVKKDLSNNIPVLFVGTPCQTQALNNFIGESKRENLLLVDFICHGVPSQSLFNQAIKEFERKKTCCVISFSFREKSESRLRNYVIRYEKDGYIHEESGEENEFPFYCGFLKYITFRDSCYECKFASSSRVSDITLGDMWGYEGASDFSKGYSLIYINTNKGEKYFSRIQNELTTQRLELDDPRTYNFAYNHHQEKDLWQCIFAFMQKYFSYPTIEKFLFRNYKSVGIFHKGLFLIIGKFNKYYTKKK